MEFIFNPTSVLFFIFIVAGSQLIMFHTMDLSLSKTAAKIEVIAEIVWLILYGIYTAWYYSVILFLLGLALSLLTTLIVHKAVHFVVLEPLYDDLQVANYNYYSYDYDDYDDYDEDQEDEEDEDSSSDHLSYSAEDEWDEADELVEAVLQSAESKILVFCIPLTLVFGILMYVSLFLQNF